MAGAGAGARFLAAVMAGEAHGWKGGAALLPQTALHTWPAARRDIAALEKILVGSRGLLGIGLDEGSAVLVSGDRAEVLGRAKAAFFDPSVSGWPWPGEDRSYLLLGPDEGYDLKTRRPRW